MTALIVKRLFLSVFHNSNHQISVRKPVRRNVLEGCTCLHQTMYLNDLHVTCYTKQKVQKVQKKVQKDKKYTKNTKHYKKNQQELPENKNP